MKYNEIKVPQLGVNDDFVILNNYLFQEGDKVTTDEIVAIVESTKMSIDINTDHGGHFFPLCEEGAEIKVNEPLGYIFETMEELNHFKAIYTSPKESSPLEEKGVSSGKVTKKAKELLKRHSLSLEDIKPESGILREKDVLNFLASKNTDVKFPEYQKDREQVVIFGCGKGSRTVMETLSTNQSYQVVGFIVDRADPPEGIDGLPVFNLPDYEFLKSKEISTVALAITNSLERLDIFRKLVKSGFKVINAIHKLAYVSPTASLGQGNHVKAGAIIDTNSKISDACIIDNNVTIPHDNIVKEGAHLAPGVTLGSSITIGKNAIVGIGSSISSGVVVGDFSVVSVGSSVTTNVEQNSVVEGVPGKVIGMTKK